MKVEARHIHLWRYHLEEQQEGLWLPRPYRPGRRHRYHRDCLIAQQLEYPGSFGVGQLAHRRQRIDSGARGHGAGPGSARV